MPFIFKYGKPVLAENGEFLAFPFLKYSLK